MRRYFFFLIYFFCAFNIFAIPNLIVEQYGVESGLPNNIVYCSLKDRDGFLWFGTWYGLCSFDGTKFTSYNAREDFDSDIPPRKIEKIVEDKNGFLWVKTIDRKLFVFNKQTERFYAVNNTVKNYVSNIQVIKIQDDGTGKVLLLTKDKNMLRSFETKNDKVQLELLYNASKVIDPQDSRLKHNVLFETKDCIGWIGQDYKIFTSQKGQKLRSALGNAILKKLSPDVLTNLSCATSVKNEVWVGDKNGALYKIDMETGAIHKYILSPSNLVKDIFVSNRHVAYAYLQNQGVFEVHPAQNQIKHLGIKAGAAQSVVVFVDKFDKLWVVEDNKSLLYWDPVNNTSKLFPVNSKAEFTNFKYQDAGEKGLFFLMSSGSMLMFDRSNLSMIEMNKLKPFDDIMPNQQFFNQMIDNDGILWLTSTAKGVYRVNSPKSQFRLLTVETKNDPTKKYGIRALFEYGKGEYLSGNRDFILYRLGQSGNILHQYTSGNEYVGSAYHIMKDRKNNLWISTKGNGLVRAYSDAGNQSQLKFERFAHQANDPYSLSNDDVYYSFCDSKGRIWVGTMGGGLNLLEYVNGKAVFKNKFNCFKRYPSYGQYLEVRNIVEDAQGRIWVGTTDGLMSFDGNFSSPENINFETYRNSNIGSNIADNDINALYRDRQSQIWVAAFGGGLNRLIRYDAKNKRPEFENFGIIQGLNTDVIVSIVEDRQNNLWLATEGGLSRFDKKTHQFRNYDKYDGLLNVKMEENSALLTSSGDLWLGCKEGILMFDPAKLVTVKPSYQTFIVNFKVSNRDLSQFKDHPILSESIKYAQSITLEHDQSMFSLEFAALDYYDPNSVTYKYILEGYEREWHFSGRNRVASYSNIPPGKYTFRVVSLDEASTNPSSERTLQIIILPPWWKSWWAYLIYTVLILALIYFAFRLFFVWTKMKNEVYISERISELKIKFFTNISHELRTPLTLIKGPIQELKDQESLSNKGREYLQLMERSTDQMQQLVNQLLDFRKIQNGKMKLHVSLFNLVDFMPYFQKEFSVLAEEKQINYSFSLPKDAVNIWADKERLGIVIRNVLSNAFKFTPNGGEIDVLLLPSVDGKEVEIQIKDTGIGIEKTKLQEIFERFVQANDDRSSYYSGTGIGLALSKEIMSLHHGDIIAESRSAGGSVFTLNLKTGRDHFDSKEVDFYLSDEDKVTEFTAPAVNSEYSTTLEQEQEESFADSEQPILLLVEDNRDMANLVKMQLEDRYRVYMASNGVEGLKKVHLHHPDIVVTDQMMPEMDGIELLTHIREDFQISHIPVIILTAKDGDESKTNAIVKGANAYITKPFSKDYLIARIEQLLAERKLFRERLWQQREEVETGDYENYLESKDVQLLDQIHKVIEDNMDDSEFNIDTIATSVGLSRSAFFKKVKSLTGLAPVDLVKEIRLNKSTELLKTTDMSIAEIAYSVGFKDSGYYIKCFRKKYNQTPREYSSEWRKS